MSSILIWGKTRDVVVGDLPPGMSAQEVDSLSALQSCLDGKATTLILADPACLDAEGAALDEWLKGGGRGHQAVVVAVTDFSDGD
jgi:hypothetical protein